MENVDPQRTMGVNYVVDIWLRLRGMNYIDDTIGMIDKK